LVASDDESGLTGVYRINLQTGRTEAVGEWSADLPPMIELSPDGRFVYYSVAGEGEDESVFRVLRKDLVGGGLEEVYRGSGGWIRRLVLSPDGSNLAASLQMPEVQTKIFVFPAVGGEARLLKSPEAKVVLSIAWTPDSKTILFAQQKEPSSPVSTVEVFSVAVAGGDPKPIGLEMQLLNHLRFHPDGRRLAFVAGESSSELWVMEGFLPGTR
jgi:Tol biopolymer transport system component